MNKETVVKKLKAKAASKVKGVFFGAVTVQLKEMAEKQASRISYRNVSGLTYGVRDNYFSNSRGTTGFNPETMDGHSYSWYKLTKKIGKHVILNNFHYSSNTRIHIGRVAEVMRDLGIKYKTVQAPRGLQDLDAALAYAVEQLANRFVQAKYGRGKYTEKQLDKILIPKGNDFKTLGLLGKKPTKKMFKEAVERAERIRTEKNKRAREEAALKRAMALVLIVSDFEGSMHGATDGAHVTKISTWAWNELGQFIGQGLGYERRQAVRDGLTKIYVHGREARHLQIVGG